MIRRLEQSHEHVVGYSLSGDVTDDEHTQLLAEGHRPTDLIGTELLWNYVS